MHPRELTPKMVEMVNHCDDLHYMLCKRAKSLNFTDCQNMFSSLSLLCCMYWPYKSSVFLLVASGTRQCVIPRIPQRCHLSIIHVEQDAFQHRTTSRTSWILTDHQVFYPAFVPGDQTDYQAVILNYFCILLKRVLLQFTRHLPKFVFLKSQMGNLEVYRSSCQVSSQTQLVL